MKPMKKILSAVLIASLLLGLIGLSGCGRYVSHYSAVGCVHSNDSDSADLRFQSFEGTMVFRLKYDGKKPANLNYTAKLKTGSATVYYDVDGTKEEWFPVRGGEEIDGRGGEPARGSFYVIVETDEPCREGEFRFVIEYPDN
jgi:hypothetical protein